MNTVDKGPYLKKKKKRKFKKRNPIQVEEFLKTANLSDLSTKLKITKGFDIIKAIHFFYR